MTILCRGSNSLVNNFNIIKQKYKFIKVIDEAERSLHDALCVVRSLVKNRGLVPGGGVPEIEIS